jgi:hypothetical protein
MGLISIALLGRPLLDLIATLNSTLGTFSIGITDMTNLTPAQVLTLAEYALGLGGLAALPL